MKSLITTLLSLLMASLFPLAMGKAVSHDISSLPKWGPYSKEYFGISHIEDLSSGMQVEFCLVPGMYRRNVQVPCALFESGVHPWRVSADMRHITYRQELEWKDQVYVDATYHIIDHDRVLLEARCVNQTPLLQNISLQLAVRGDNRAHTDGDASGGDAPGLRVDIVGFLLYLCYVSNA